MAVHGTAMHGLPKRTTLDAPRLERFHQTPGTHPKLFLVNQNGVEPENTLSPGGLWHPSDARHLVQAEFITGRDFSLLGDVRAKHFDLGAANGRLYICQSVVVPQRTMHKLHRIVLRLRAKVLGFSGPVRIGCNNRTTASGGDDFVAVEAETSNISQRAGEPSAVRRAQAFARILDHNQSKFAG